MTPPRPPAYVSIPHGLPTQAVASTQDVKAYAVFYQLKSLYAGGVIFHYRARARAIARHFGYGERKLRTYLKLLLARGLAAPLGKDHLVLLASAKLGAALGVSQKKYWRVATHHLGQLETVLRALAVEENLLKQRHLLRRRVVEDIIATHVGIPHPATTLQPARYRNLSKSLVADYDQQLRGAQARYTQAVASLLPPPGGKQAVFPWATLSRQGLATALHRRSKATGQRYAKKMAALGLLSETRHAVVIGDFSYEDYQQLQKTHLQYDPTYQFREGVVRKVLPNLLTLLPTS